MAPAVGCRQITLFKCPFVRRPSFRINSLHANRPATLSRFHDDGNLGQLLPRHRHFRRPFRPRTQIHARRPLLSLPSPSFSSRFLSTAAPMHLEKNVDTLPTGSKNRPTAPVVVNALIKSRRMEIALSDGEKKTEETD